METLRAQNAELRARLAEAEETLEAIRSGAVDALVVEGKKGVQVFTLKGADQPYRVLVETMNEGALTIDSSGVILFANQRFADLVQSPLHKVLGASFEQFLLAEDQPSFKQFLQQIRRSAKRMEVRMQTSRAKIIFAHLSGSRIVTDEISGFCLVATDITRRKEAEMALRHMPQSILQAQEQERRRVARELHDSVNQILSATKFRIHSVEHQLDASNADLSHKIKKAKELIEKAINEVRVISRNLHPSELDDLGLLAAIRTLVADFRERTRIRVQFSGPRRVAPLAPELQMTVYRIIQEALTNIERHSAASRAEVLLRKGPEGIRLGIRDNGKGFRALKRKGKTGLGMENMRERATLVGGTLDIKSIVGQGTEIFVQIPS